MNTTRSGYWCYDEIQTFIAGSLMFLFGEIVCHLQQIRNILIMEVITVDEENNEYWCQQNIITLQRYKI